MAMDEKTKGLMLDIISKQRKFFLTGKTKDVEFRMKALDRLEAAVLKYVDLFYMALKEDLHKSEMESYMTEIGIVLNEIRYVKRHLKGWVCTKRRSTPLHQFHASSFCMPEPYGLVFIIAPWNYPLNLSISPLIGAIAAGNCCVMKPSEFSKNTTDMLEFVISKAFKKEYIAVVQGDKDISAFLLDQKFDYIFYTGSTKVGRIVMEKAAKNLTPVTLELGGKSPCIVDKYMNLNLAAKRIVFGKFMNAGQTCVAPDHVLVHEDVEKILVRYMKKWIAKMFTSSPLLNEDYPSIISGGHFDRLLGLMKNQKVAVGGRNNKKKLMIEPTILVDVERDSAVMQEEIFGPILPVLTYSDLNEVVKELQNKDKPLALYIFSNRRASVRKILRNVSFGGGCVNDTVMHVANGHVGFGGVGESGMGDYHGKCSFETFSHKKNILKKYNWIDLPFRYQPYSDLKEMMVHMFLH